MRLRRPAAALGLALAALVALAPSASAASPEAWWSHPEPPRGSAVNGVPLATLGTRGPLTGGAYFEPGIALVSFRLSEDSADGPADPCSAFDDVRRQDMEAGSRKSVEFSFTAPFPCNRRYQVEVTVTPNQEGPLTQHTPTVLPLYVDVAIPPAATSGLTATVVGSRRAISLRWDDAAHEPDFLGFEIRRSVGDKAFAEIGTAGPTATSFVDEELPSSAKKVRYRVVAMRSGPQDGSVVYAAEGDTTTTALEPEDGDGGSDGDDDDDSGSGGSGDGDGSGGARSGSGSSRLRTQLPSGPGSRGAVGRFDAPTTPTTADTGFAGTLPFQRGSTDASQEALPSGDPAVVARIDDDDTPGTRDTMLLVAGGGVAFSWAMALRLLSRRFSGL